MNIGKGIKLVMRGRGLTQKELASQINISEKSMSLIIRGVTNPNGKTVRNISRQLKVAEPALRILGIERTDIIERKRCDYDLIWPIIENTVLFIFAG
jgi:transcriptional regulator with XRE-family HTH domain